MLHDKNLQRFWFAMPGVLGIGVTAYSRSEAENLECKAAEQLGQSFDPTALIEDIDVLDVDQNHVIPNIGPPNFRGVWFPQFSSS